MEALHKEVRFLRERRARLFSGKQNILDVMRRINTRADPCVTACGPSPVCVLCNKRGHTKASCQNVRKPNMSAEDQEFFSFVIED